MREAVFKIALAGLLHDIGKFAQRAATEGERVQWDAKAEAEFKVEHAWYTDQVVSEIVPDLWGEEVRAAAGRHHHPQTHLERVVALADRLSAGEPADERQDHPQQLQSIFLSIGQADALPRQYLPLKPLALEQEVIFPAAEVNGSDVAYKKLWDEFRQQAQALRQGQVWDETTLDVYLTGLLDLMQRYTWCIPSAYYRSTPDVSLYDHSRMTAALAACLLAYDEAKVEIWLKQEHQDEPAVLLVGGDISGVQSFIYTITSSGAAKSLRGRSFYLQLLTEAVARYVLDRLDLPLTNLIYAGGGNFFLLAQVGQETKLDQVAQEVSLKLLEAHDGELHLILAYADLSPKQLGVNEFHLAWDNFHSNVLNRKKLQPLANLEDESLMKEVGTGLGVGGDEEQLCAICGREDSQTQDKESGGEIIRTCRLCASFEELGNQLVKATHLVTLYSEPSQRQRVDRWWQGLELFGVNFWVVDTTKKPEHPSGRYVYKIPRALRFSEVYPHKPEAAYSRELAQELAQNPGPRLETLRLFAQLVPTGRDGNPLTFDELAETMESNGHRWSGTERWGVLRLDVDNLGSLFSQGFKGKTGHTLTLSRLGSLSFALRLFFEGWLAKLGQDPRATDRLRRRLYVQYAGGDDLFVVGAWDALPEFALDIQDSFRVYVSKNPDVTLSGGISLATVKYPLYRAAEEAEAAEKKAKKYQRANGSAKDAFCFLGQVTGWEDFGAVKTRAYQLAEWCGENGPASRTLLQTLMSIHREYRAGRDKAIIHKKWQPGQTFFGPWMWHLAYQMAQWIEDKRTPQPIKEELRQLEKELLENQQKIENIGLAARWAQLLIRK